MIDDLFGKSNGEVIEWFRQEINKAKTDSYYDEFHRRCEERRQNIENDFNAEWSKKHFKWFFKKRRQKKLRAQIVRRYTAPVFWLIEDMIEEMLPQTINENFQQFVDVKDVAVGDRAYFTEEDS